MSVATIERMAGRGTLEVEHLLRLARNPSPAVADALDALSAKIGWTSATPHEVPFGQWSVVVSAYCRNGFPGLRQLAQQQDFAPFVLGLLEDLHSHDALDCILESFPAVLENCASDPTLAQRIAAALNLTLSFKPWIVPSADQGEQVRCFLHRLVASAQTDATRAIAYCALRQVGDSSSLSLLSTLPPLSAPWAGALLACKRAIAKRSRTQV